MPEPARLLLALLGAAALAGCPLNYEEARVAQNISEEIPDTVLTRFTHTVVTGGKVWVRLSADRAESYGKSKRITLSGVRFEEYDGAGRLVTEGRADRAVFHTDSENAEVSGDILIRAPEEKASLSAGRLAWTKDGKRLESGAGEFVRIAKEDGAFVEGRGLRADFRRRRLEFAEPVTGRFVEDAGGEP